MQMIPAAHRRLEKTYRASRTLFLFVCLLACPSRCVYHAISPISKKLVSEPPGPGRLLQQQEEERLSQSATLLRTLKKDLGFFHAFQHAGMRVCLYSSDLGFGVAGEKENVARPTEASVDTPMIAQLDRSACVLSSVSGISSQMAWRTAPQKW